MINIEVQDVGGNWLRVNSTPDRNPQNVAARLSEVARSYPGKRVRAVDAAGGAVIDLW